MRWSIGLERSSLIAGHIIGVKKDSLVVKITEGHAVALSAYQQNTFYVNFFINRTNYQIQHHALNWFEQHSLHSILISNPRFDEMDYNWSPSSKERAYTFR